MHREGRPAREVAIALTDLCDHTLEHVYRLALEGTPVGGRAEIVMNLSLVALGGYGRRDLAPHSDIDLLFLLADGDYPALRPFISRMVRDLWDVGLSLSHSVRTVGDCIASARQDLTHCTALGEARLLIGGTRESSSLQRKVHRLFASMPINRFVDDIEAERAQEHQDYHAQTVLLLEPNLKKSPGGLRDYHALRWVALARHGINEPDMLRAAGILSDFDAETLQRACEFLQKLRAEMHFSAGAAQDVLTREEQLRLAEWMGFCDDEQMLGVERFMQQYYRHTTGLRDVVMRFLEGARQPRLLDRISERFSTERVEQHFLRSRRSIAIAPEALETVLADGEQVLHLFDLARDYDVNVTHETLERIRAAVDGMAVPPKAHRRFLQLLANPTALGGVLRQLDRVGLLGRLLPPFVHAHCLIQFNLYHKYTVDEHSFRAVEAAARRQDEQSAPGQAYREIRRKDLLHLALLLHDVGKGMGEDHCETGRAIAEQVGRDFQLNEHERHLLVFLVHQHLLMANTAFRRDLDDPATLVQFTRAVATPETLRMLYLMTAADTEAVSPENWTTWKESLLNELYFRTAEALTGEAPVGDEASRKRAICEDLGRSLVGRFSAEWLAFQLSLMPLSYLESTPTSRIDRDLRILLDMPAGKVAVEYEFLPKTGFVEYTVYTQDNIVDGLFSRITGVLTAAGIRIVTARIVTRTDGTVIDKFTGQDLTFTGEPPAGRSAEVAGQIVGALSGNLDVESLLARRRSAFSAPMGPRLHMAPQVEIDNDSSGRFTIIEVFAEDCLGRLYAITRTLVGLGLSVWSARINTQADQIVDVFYVTDGTGGRVVDEAQLTLVSTALLEALCTE